MCVVDVTSLIIMSFFHESNRFGHQLVRPTVDGRGMRCPEMKWKAPNPPHWSSVASAFASTSRSVFVQIHRVAVGRKGQNMPALGCSRQDGTTKRWLGSVLPTERRSRSTWRRQKGAVHAFSLVSMQGSPRPLERFVWLSLPIARNKSWTLNAASSRTRRAWIVARNSLAQCRSEWRDRRVQR